MARRTVDQSVWGRARDDFVAFARTYRFRLAEMIALLAAAPLAAWRAPNGWNVEATAAFGAGVAIVSALGLALLIYCGLLAAAPVLQRNELREALRSGSAFQVRPVSGSGFRLFRDREAYAQLAIRSLNQLLRKSSARLKHVIPIDQGRLLSASQWDHMDFQPRALQWSSREHAYGGHHQWLDIPNDGEERFLDVAVVDASKPGRFRIVSANPEDRTEFPGGDYKLEITVASETEQPNARKVELLLSLHPRSGPIPAPLVLMDWHPHGERLLLPIHTDEAAPETPEPAPEER